MMVGLKIPPENIEEIVKILGLSTEQSKTYINLLSLGSATLGQISLLSGLDYLKIQDALQVLIGSNLVRRIPGKVGRYIALEPFLKSFSLAYDPITLVNIRKESANILKIQETQINDHFSKAILLFQESTSSLGEDFIQSLEPVKYNFTELTNNLRNVVKSTDLKIDESIQKVLSNAQLLADESKALNEKIKVENLKKISIIPELFNNYTPLIEQELDSVEKNCTESIENSKNMYKSALNILERNFLKSMELNSEQIKENIISFEQKRMNEQKGFQIKVSEIQSSLDQIRANMAAKKNNFKIIHNGYKEVNESILKTFTEISSIIDRISPLIRYSIDDIQNRKLFKGKEEFLNNLNDLEEEKESILRTLENYKKIEENITFLNSTLDETEVEIVNATESGLKNMEEVLENEVKSISSDLEKIKNEITSTDSNELHLTLNNAKSEVQTQINKLHSDFEQNITDLRIHFGKIIKEIINNLSRLLKHMSDDYKTELETYFQMESFIEAKSGKLWDIMDKLNEIISSPNSEIRSIYEDILSVEEKFNNFISGLNAFTSGFTDMGVKSFISTLDKTKEYIKSLIEKIENQLEQEISALIFTIKEMKQKLSKILDASRLDQIPDFESSLLSSDLIVGESVIIMLLKDLTVRAKASLTILMPRPELQTLHSASKLPMRTRVNIIGDFTRVPKSTLKRILSSDNVHLKQFDGVDFWGCIRDSEELLICPEPKDPAKEELLGVLTTNENLVELFSKEILTYTTRSREILPQDLD